MNKGSIQTTKVTIDDSDEADLTGKWIDANGSSILVRELITGELRWSDNQSIGDCRADPEEFAARVNAGEFTRLADYEPDNSDESVEVECPNCHETVLPNYTVFCDASSPRNYHRSAQVCPQCGGRIRGGGKFA